MSERASSIGGSEIAAASVDWNCMAEPPRAAPGDSPDSDGLSGSERSRDTAAVPTAPAASALLLRRMPQGRGLFANRGPAMTHTFAPVGSRFRGNRAPKSKFLDKCQRSQQGSAIGRIGEVMNGGTVNVLFVCKGGSVRSIMAASLLNRLGKGCFRAFSAGIEPAAEVHPLVIELLRDLKFPLDDVRPRSFEEFLKPEAPKMDFVISVSDLAQESFWARWPSSAFRGRWRITSPVAAAGDLTEQRAAFRRAFTELDTRIRLFILAQHRIVKVRLAA